MHDAAASIARIDPAQCRPVPARLPIQQADCRYLIDNIRDHGQLVAGLVRRAPPEDSHRYEIICGARRHFAIATLRATEPRCASLPFLAAIRPLTDEAAFAAADRDNRHRRDISDYQRAILYKEALAIHYAGNQLAMARAISISPGNLSRYLTLAALPKEILAAVGDPTHLTIAHLRKLLVGLKNADGVERVVTLAIQIADEQTASHAAGNAYAPVEEVFARLAEAVSPPAPPAPSHTVAAADGATIATGRLGRDGHARLEIFAPLAAGRAAILAAFDEIMGNLIGTEKGWHCKPFPVQ